MTTHQKRLQKGFTLIELMIVLVVLSILVAVALPSYQRAITRGNRADAQAALLGFAQAMERHFQQNYTFAAAADGGGDTGAPAANIFPSTSPLDGDAQYNLTIQAADAGGFTLRATPVPGGPQDGDGILEVNSLGRRGWDQDNDGAIGAAEFTWDQ